MVAVRAQRSRGRAGARRRDRTRSVAHWSVQARGDDVICALKGCKHLPRIVRIVKRQRRVLFAAMASQGS